MANAVTMGKAYVVIGAKISNEFTAALSAVQKSLAGVGRSMQNIGKPIMAMGASITGALQGATIAAIKGQEAFADMAVRTGASVELLSEFGYAAGLADVEIGALETSLIKMSLAQQQLREGLPMVVGAFREIGIEAKDIEGLSVDQVFERVADGLSKVTDQAKKATIARTIFGRGGVAMLPAISGGAAGIAAGRAEAVRVGASVTTEAAQKADAAGDMFQRLTAAIQGLMNAIGNVLIDRMIQVTTILTNLIARTSEYVRQHPELVAQAQAFGIALLEVGAAITGVGLAMEGISYLFTPGGMFVVGAAMVLYFTGVLDELGAKWKDVVLAFEIGGKSVSQWLQVAADAWAATLPVFGAITSDMIAIFKNAWEAFAPNARSIGAMIGNEIAQGVFGAMKRIAQNVVEIYNWIRIDLARKTGLVSDEELAKRERGREEMQASIGAFFKGQSDQASAVYGELGGNGGAPALKTPDFSKTKAALAKTAEELKGIVGKPISDAIATVFGDGSSKVKSAADILKDLSQGYGAAPSQQGGPSSQQEPGRLRAARVAFETRGAFSGLAAGQLSGSGSILVQGMNKQLAVQNRIESNTARTADALDDALTYD